jgi:hypothetical protein
LLSGRPCPVGSGGYFKAGSMWLQFFVAARLCPAGAGQVIVAQIRQAAAAARRCSSIDVEPIGAWWPRTWTRAFRIALVREPTRQDRRPRRVAHQPAAPAVKREAVLVIAAVMFKVAGVGNQRVHRALISYERIATPYSCQKHMIPSPRLGGAFLCGGTLASQSRDMA